MTKCAYKNISPLALTVIGATPVDALSVTPTKAKRTHSIFKIVYGTKTRPGTTEPGTGCDIVIRMPIMPS